MLICYNSKHLYFSGHENIPCQIINNETFFIGRDELLELMFKRLCFQEEKNVVDVDGNSILHVIVQYKSCDAERKNALIDRCIRNGCSPFIFDQNEKLAIEYCTQDDMCYSTLSKTMTDAGL